MLELKEKMFISYDNMSGQIIHMNNSYFTFTPFNSGSLILVYKQHWKDVTVL